jgi:hypothetical protein
MKFSLTQYKSIIALYCEVARAEERKLQVAKRRTVDYSGNDTISFLETKYLLFNSGIVPTTQLNKLIIRFIHYQIQSYTFS